MGAVIFAIVMTFTTDKPAYLYFEKRPTEALCQDTLKNFRRSDFKSILNRRAQAAGDSVKEIRLECITESQMFELQDSAEQ
jgi:hypothetical protein